MVATGGMRMRRGLVVALVGGSAIATSPLGSLAATRSVAWSAFESQTRGAGFQDVDVKGGADGWAVGLRSGGPCQYLTLTARWNGTTWTETATPNVPGVNSVLAGVAVVSSSEAWAVGSSSCPGVQDGRTLIER